MSSLAYSYAVGIMDKSHDEAKAFEAFAEANGAEDSNINELGRLWWDYQDSLRATDGNPGEGTLHDMLAEVADHVDYEANVVEAAAEEIGDPEIKEKAEDQAEAMEEAAEALDDAADAARETAAEVFNETGIPQEQPKDDPNEDDAVRGNPEITEGEYEAFKQGQARGVGVRHDLMDNVGIQSSEEFFRAVQREPEMVPEPLSGEFAGESINELLGPDATEGEIDAYEEGYYSAIFGNPGEWAKAQHATAGNPVDPNTGNLVAGNPEEDGYVLTYLLDNGQRVTMGTQRPHLSKSQAESMAERARNAGATDVEINAVGGNPTPGGGIEPGEPIPSTEVIEGNPSETIPAPSEPVPDSGHEQLVPVDSVPAPPEPVPDAAPTPSHWYTRPLFGKGK